MSVLLTFTRCSDNDTTLSSFAVSSTDPWTTLQIFTMKICWFKRGYPITKQKTANTEAKANKRKTAEVKKYKIYPLPSKTEIPEVLAAESDWKGAVGRPSTFNTFQNY